MHGRKGRIKGGGGGGGMEGVGEGVEGVRE